MSYDDFEGEFSAIKEYSYNDLKNDKFVRHFRKPREDISMRLPAEKNVVLADHEDLSEYLREKKKRRLLRQMRKSEEPRSVGPEKKRRVYLVPMEEDYRQKMLAWIEKRRKGEENAGGAKDSEAKAEDPEVKVEDSDEAENAQNAQEENAKLVEAEELEQSQTARFHELESLDSEQESVRASNHDVSLMQNTILQQIHGSHISERLTLHAPYKEICSLFEQTVYSSESHTAFLMGASGTGKTLIVNTALEKMRRKHPETFIVIRLGGDMHRSDTVAIREFARQLDMQVKGLSSVDSAFEQRSISDTFDNILSALQKHDEKENEVVRILIVIDKIDEYTKNPRQTLLYNLLDLCQSSRIPICLLGITQNIAIRENLEKRVRSRFSQRIIETRKAKSMEEFLENAVIPLKCSVAGFDDEEYPKLWNQYVDRLSGKGRESENRGDENGMLRIASEIFASTRNYKHFLNCCCLPVKSISVHNPFLQPKKFEIAYGNMVGDNVNSQMESLLEVEKLLLIAASRWAEKSATKQVNFKLAYKEYETMVKSSNLEATTLTSKTSSIDNLSLAGIKVTRTIMSAKALKDSWATLYKYGLIFDIITSNSEVNAHNNHNRNRQVNLADDKMLQVDVSLGELGHMAPESLRRFTKL